MLSFSSAASSRRRGCPPGAGPRRGPRAPRAASGPPPPGPHSDGDDGAEARRAERRARRERRGREGRAWGPPSLAEADRRRAAWDATLEDLEAYDRRLEGPKARPADDPAVSPPGAPALRSGGGTDNGDDLFAPKQTDRGGG